MSGTVAVAVLTLFFFAAPLAAQSPCLDCLAAVRAEFKKCLENAISQEDKKSCADKKEAQAKTCEDGECKIERAQSEPKGPVVPKPK
ncbi:MAG: hypothetical protein Q8N04_01950 [Nitrospira sp.]|nr:hypothetical protein [Nitrospira sp.]